MATIYAITNGNWSDGSTWSSGTVPTVDDDVWLNGHQITMNISPIYANTIHNKENSEIGVVSGGKIVNTANGTRYVYANLDAIDNIITSNTQLFITGNVSSLTTYAANNSNKAYSTIYINNTYVYSMNPSVKIIGDVNTDINSIGQCISASYGWSGYNSIKIIGNITHLGGYLVPQWNLNASDPRTNGVEGNLYAEAPIAAGPFNQGSTIILFDGDVTIKNSSQTVTNIHIIGDLLVEGNSQSLSGSRIDGKTTFKNILSNYIFDSINGANFNHFYNEADTPYLFPSYGSVTAVKNIIIRGEFHIGNYDYQTNWSLGLLMEKITFRENGKLFVKKQPTVFLAQEYVIENPDVFEVVYEGDGQQTMAILPYRNNSKLNYPTEQQVAQGVTYGMQNEYEGRLALPPESTVLKDVEYGGDKVGTLEVIALSGATATAENISVVNLTEQEVNRVKNCATVSTVQKCFEDFKEE